MELKAADLDIQKLGVARIDSPIGTADGSDGHNAIFVDDAARVLVEHRLDHLLQSGATLPDLPAFEIAGPRRKIYFDPSKTRCGIVTCGGLCPGINDVIRGLVRELMYRYDVKHISGFRYGYEGFIAKYGHDVIDLANQFWVEHISGFGGTVLGSSRGNQSAEEIVDCLEQMSLRILFTIGGDGTMRGALAISREIAQRNLKIAVVGIPKTIDNDILYLDKSFGFETAFSEACESVVSAHTESECSMNGVGIVKLMGRESGFIACNAALATGVPNFVLIPEVPFTLEGERGFLKLLEARLAKRHHACIVVAEGAGQDLIAGEDLGKDASGNIRLKDIGTFLSQKIKNYLTARGLAHAVRYIDPSYMIRSVPATPKDRLYCMRLAQSAVHAGMSGRTEMVVGRWHEQFTHLPMTLVATGRNHVNPEGDLWQSVLETTGQPAEIG